jgi:ATP-binding cassette subfamily B protein
MENDFEEQESDQIKTSTFAILKQIGKYIKPHIWSFALGLVFYIVLAAIEVALPIVTGLIIDSLDVADPQYITIVHYSIIFAVIVAFNGFFRYTGSMLIQKSAQEVVYDLREDVFKKIESFSIGQISEMPIGKWVTRVTNDTNSVLSFFSNVLVSLIYNSLVLIIVIVAVLITNLQLGLILVAFLPFIFAISFAFARVSRKNYREVRKNISSMNAFLSENLSAMNTIQIFNQQANKEIEFQKVNKRLKIANYKAVNVYTVFRPLIYLLYVGAIFAVFGVGLKLVADDQMTIGGLYSFYLLTERFFNPVQAIANLFNQIQSALAGAERVLSVLNKKTAIQDCDNPVDLGRAKGKIEFKNVWFAYTPGEWILQDVSFVINPGETVAFVGETGAGKSTIITLMVRNYDIQEGQILIDGVDIREISLESLRRNIGQMLQDVFLFSGTIKSNISLDNDEIDDETIINSAQYVGADRFIERLENKYDQEVLENGNNFSSGERQLISFARVVTYMPPIIVLDEATSNIDTETEVIIQNSLEKIKSIGTMVMVAHRLSTIKHASQIYVVDGGKIIEQGNHQTLLKKRGIYYNLYRIQSMKKKIENV